MVMPWRYQQRRVVVVGAALAAIVLISWQLSKFYDSIAIKIFSQQQEKTTSASIPPAPPPPPPIFQPTLSPTLSPTSSPSTLSPAEERCAILLYGLPRNFKAFVLPSLIQNVIIPNAPYNCDYYMHYYNLEQEQPGWAGNGGPVHVQDVFLLESAVRAIANTSTVTLLPDEKSNSIANIAFVNNTDEEFRQRYKDLLHHIATDEDEQGELIYVPRFRNFTVPMVENIIKMWHGQELVWNLTMHHAKLHHINYTRLAVLRNDVIFFTPIDIWKRGHNGTVMDLENRHAVVPGFAKWPVNDRMIQGPYGAVKIWAAGRFSRLPEHMEKVKGTKIGIHSENYLNMTIFPAIRQAGYLIEEDSKISFCRVRTDDTNLTYDCWKGKKSALEQMIGRKCHRRRTVRFCPAPSNGTHEQNNHR